MEIFCFVEQYDVYLGVALFEIYQRHAITANEQLNVFALFTYAAERNLYSPLMLILSQSK